MGLDEFFHLSSIIKFLLESNSGLLGGLFRSVIENNLAIYNNLQVAGSLGDIATHLIRGG